MKVTVGGTFLLFSFAVMGRADNPPEPVAGEASSTMTVTYRIDRSQERSCFQVFQPYSPEIDVRSDVAIVYGVNDTITSRIAEWKRQGYVAHMMTGSAWGEYEDYIEGRFDGRTHADEGQVDRDGNVIWHHGSVPYMVPTPSFVAYLKSLTRKAIDAGAEAVHLEEPEFWARAGYSEGFKRLWKTEYDEEWQRPDSSADAFWRAARLKYFLYKRTLDEVFRDAKEYAATKGQSVRCFVPTHSLVNYAQWGIVSPESSLMDLENCDGYIAQVWTGTARTPNFYRGVARERTFETAFLEYASMHSMVAPTGRTVYFLADPVEDDPNHTWDDYRSNYLRVVVASLLFPDVNNFEVMPWPDRVMTGRYPAGSYGDAKTTQTTIPPSYASELMTVVNALHEMKPSYDIRWETGSPDIAVLVSDTMMFQRGVPWEWDIEFSDYYGLALPLVKHGIPARSVILERVLDPHAFDGIRILLASYDHMKPLQAEHNEALAAWIRGGGILLYWGNDSDRFQEVREWWNEDGKKKRTPREDLFERLGIAADAKAGRYAAGKGAVVYTTERPRDLALAKDGADKVMAVVARAAEESGEPVRTGGHLFLQRGPYSIGAVLDETGSSEPLRLKGYYCDLFTSGMPVLKDPEIGVGEVFLFRKMEKGGEREPYVGGNLRLESVEQYKGGKVQRLLFRGVSAVEEGMFRIHASRPPVSIEVEGSPGAGSFEWSPETETVLVRFPNRSGGTAVRVHHAP